MMRDEAHVHSGYVFSVHMDKHMACAVLGGSNNLQFMKGYTSQLRNQCYNCLMYEVDDDYDS